MASSLFLNFYRYSKVVNRKLVHTRQVAIQVFRRDDALWDIEATLSDVKTQDAPLPSGDRKAGDPMHDMLLCLTVDQRFNVVAAKAHSRRNPYPGYCEAAEDGYAKLVGLNLIKGFRKAVRERLGAVLGCTHISELSQFLPTAAIQAFAGEPDTFATIKSALSDPREAPEPADKHFQIDRCHGMRSDGPAVQLYFPKWFKPVRT
jgi:Protein of unknown function (DUF2889)